MISRHACWTFADHAFHCWEVILLFTSQPPPRPTPRCSHQPLCRHSAGGVHRSQQCSTSWRQTVLWQYFNKKNHNFWILTEIKLCLKFMFTRRAASKHCTFIYFLMRLYYTVNIIIEFIHYYYYYILNGTSNLNFRIWQSIKLNLNEDGEI